MNKTYQSVAVAIAIAFIFILNSCTPETPEVEKRTLQMELAEINEVLKQIEDAGLNIDTSELGIYYVIDTLGAEPFPQFGDTLFMKYTGYFLDGYVFDDSGYYERNVDGIWSFIFKKGTLVPGFEDGISLMSKGTKLNMFIPSSLAYGAIGTATIQPYSTLRFEAEMIDIKPTSE